MTKLADFYQLNASFSEGTVAEVAVEVLSALAHPPWPAPAWHRTPMSVKDTPRREGSPLEAARAGELGRSLEWERDGLYHGAISPREDRVAVSVAVFDTAPEHAWRWVRALEEVVTRILERNEVVLATAVVQRIGTGVACVPSLPLVNRGSYVVAADDDALAWAYESAEAMIAAGGWEARTISGCRLLSRAMHAETNVELLEAILEGQFAMARVVKPGLAKYELHPPQPEEREIFAAGAPRLSAVGYDPGDAAAIYACAAGADEHVQPWELWMLGQLLKDGRLPGGEAVREVRVVFPDRAAAWRERRPLLDLGVAVQFYDAGGALAALPKDA